MIKTDIATFLQLAAQHPVLDVRSPGEYGHAHIPGAYSLPLFTDEERKVVGTAYKQQGRQPAIKEGLDFFGPKMRTMVEQAEHIVAAHNSSKAGANPQTPPTVLVHCWRGGMRSGGVAWLLGLYGFKVHTLAGGYKSFRNWVLQQFRVPLPIAILGGHTGSGKTKLLHQLAAAGEPTIDLEGLARHKGSAFGGLEPGTTPPTQEQFENQLAMGLYHHSLTLQPGQRIWLEDESQRIGTVNLPPALWAVMRQSPLFFLDIPFEPRLQHLVQEYGKYTKEQLVNATMRIQKRLGGLQTRNAIGHLLDDDHTGAFRILLAYYDKCYDRSLAAAPRNVIHVPSNTTDAQTNSQLLLQLPMPA